MIPDSAGGLGRKGVLDAESSLSGGRGGALWARLKDRQSVADLTALRDATQHLLQLASRELPPPNPAAGMAQGTADGSVGGDGV
jgi:hypothetical protein